MDTDHDQAEPIDAREQLPLPGLDEPARPAAVSELERAVRRTIAALRDQDLLTEADSASLQMMIELARIVSMKITTRRASTVSNDLRLLWEIKDSFTKADEEANEELAAAMRKWAEELGLDVPESLP